MDHSEIIEPFERMLAEVFTSSAIRAIEAGGEWRPAWDAMEQSGYLDALVSEEKGGFGLGWAVAAALFQALGKHAVPLPVGETIILRGLQAEAGEAAPVGPLQPAVASGSLDSHLSEATSATPVTIQSEKLSPQLALLYSAQIAGAAARLLDMTVAYANERAQFGKPIGRQQAVQQQLAVMAEQVVATRLAVELASACGEPDRLRAASAKAIASRYAASIAATAHAVHGAIGISAEYDLQLYTRRLYAWRLAGGAESHWEVQLGEAVLASSNTSLDWVRANLDR